MSSLIHDLKLRDEFPGFQDLQFNPKRLVAWVEKNTPEVQHCLAHEITERLIQLASAHEGSPGKACSKLCGFVEQCAKASSPVLLSFASAEDTAWSLYGYYMTWNEAQPHRAMKTILDVLKRTMQANYIDAETGESIRAKVMQDVMSIIVRRCSKPAIKSALVILAHYMNEKLIYSNEVVYLFQKVLGIPAMPEQTVDQAKLDATWLEIAPYLFDWMAHDNICRAACQLVVAVLTKDKHYSDFPDNPPAGIQFTANEWHKFLRQGLDANVNLLEPVKLHVLTTLLGNLGHDRYIEFMNLLSELVFHKGLGDISDNAELDTDLLLWLSAVEIYRKNEARYSFVASEDNAIWLRAEEQCLESVLRHPSVAARTSAVAILLGGVQTAESRETMAMLLLRAYLPSYHADADPKFRYEVLAHERTLVQRTSRAIAKATREERVARAAERARASRGLSAPQPQGTTDASLADALEHHLIFFRWYIHFLQTELQPTASYQRHITALKAIIPVLETEVIEEPASRTQEGFWPFPPFDDHGIRLFLDLLLDPFDDVRDLAARNLMMLSDPDDPRLKLSKPLFAQVQDLCVRASSLAGRTARADHADGLARSFRLLCHLSEEGAPKIAIPLELLAQLEAQLDAAEKDLARAVLDAPIHGSFASLSCIWPVLSEGPYTTEEYDELAVLQERIVAACRRNWQTVRHVLCDDSPEGHLPEELEEVEGLDTKDVLSYSFRAVHESSILLRALVGNAGFETSNFRVAPERSIFRELGNLTFEQLSNLRHRGAFSTVSQTFAYCCQMMPKYSSATGDGPDPPLLEPWYQGARDCIFSQASTTRRSAGIPALVVGILSANADRPSFGEVMTELREIALLPARVTETDGTNLPQVHALNCIKDIFKSSLLNKKAARWLTESLELAMLSLRSEVWAIRNCGLLLIRSLIDNVFGTNESKASMEAGWDGESARIDWHKYARLSDGVLDLLKLGQAPPDEQSEGSTVAEAVFPALDVVRRAGPPEGIDRDEVFDVVAFYLGSRLWHIREIAARTLCSLLLRPDWIEPILDLVYASTSSANRLHGALTAFRFLLERLSETMPQHLLGENGRRLISVVPSFLNLPGSFATSPAARSVVFEIIGLTERLQVDIVGHEDASPTRTLLFPSAAAFRARAFPGGAQSDESLVLVDAKYHQAVFEYLIRAMPSRDAEGDKLDIVGLLEQDEDAASEVLDYMLAHSLDVGTYMSIVVPYQTAVEVCFGTTSVRPRVLAWNIISRHLDILFPATRMEVAVPLEVRQVMQALWADQRSKPMTPGLTDAMVRASGATLAMLLPPLAVVLRRDEVLARLMARETAGLPAQKHDASLSLTSWGLWMANTGVADKNFDSRMAAAQAMRSFSARAPIGHFPSTPYDLTVGEKPDGPAHLAWLFALYDSLNDDDDEIRLVAAEAAASILGSAMLSMEAGRALLTWMGRSFTASPEFAAHVASRMAGHRVSSRPAGEYHTEAEILADWTSAEDQLAKALVMDDALFVVEEQNLYVCKVREVDRWRHKLPKLHAATAHKQSGGPQPAFLDALIDWTTTGLGALRKAIQEQGEDGALGWSTKPDVFAVCARVLLCGTTLATMGYDQVEEELVATVNMGADAKLHGGLVFMGVLKERNAEWLDTEPA